MNILECQKAKLGLQNENCEICFCGKCEHEFLSPFFYEEGKEICEKGCLNCESLKELLIF